ncbi:hypothetical protein [Heyndrickxia acidicola]|uniref:Uncharacterized protein n=1 Tax=Heyndrickxia acidicola TaxID=209389 RepID=A0ABU6MEI6_9BACI|nr:hypothetical protein [Heyndrickxia acidicola]MED1201677.1 hypothetical protein [Heyndrickxia acidicola]
MKINLQDDQSAAYVHVQSHFEFISKVHWSGYARLLLDQLAFGRPNRSLRRGSRPPAESELLQLKSTQQEDQIEE